MTKKVKIYVEGKIFPIVVEYEYDNEDNEYKFFNKLCKDMENISDYLVIEGIGIISKFDIKRIMVD